MIENDERTGVFSSYGTRGLLLASGLIAAGIAALFLIAPVVFYGGYGINIDANVSLGRCVAPGRTPDDSQRLQSRDD